MPPSRPPVRRRLPGGLLRAGWLAPLGLLLLALLLAWGARLLYAEREQHYRHIIESSLAAINQLQVRSVASWRQRRLGEAEALSSDAVLARAVALWQQQPTPVRQERLRERLAGLVEHMQYAAAYLVDLEGRLLLDPQGVAGGSLPQAERAALEQALALGQAQATELQQHARFAFPYVALVAPLYDESGPVGALWLVLDARVALYPLLQAWPGGSRTSAASMLLRRQGDEVLFLSPLRQQDVPPASLRLNLWRSPDAPVVRAAQGARGTLYGHNHQGTAVLASAGAVPGTSWLLVSEIDAAEAFAEIRYGGWLSLTLYVSLSMLLLGTLATLWQRSAWRRERGFKERVQEQMRWLEAAQRAASVGYFVYDAERKLFTMSDMANTIFGLPLESDMTLRQWIEMLDGQDREPMLQAHARAMAEHRPLRVQYRIHPQGGLPLRWVEVRAEFGDGKGSPRSRMTGTVQDITERRQAELQREHYRAALEAQVRIDPLTRLANRMALDEHMAQEWERAQRGAAPLALLMIDVDRFKAYNDHYGHVAGDRCLQSVARALALDSGRAGDLVARYGGEEFAVLLPGADEAQALAVAERLRLAVRALGLEHAASAGEDGIVTVSVGAASVLPHLLAQPPAGAGMDAAQVLLRRADAALYRVKRCGRDQSMLYGPHCDSELHAPAGQADEENV